VIPNGEALSEKIAHKKIGESQGGDSMMRARFIGVLVALVALSASAIVALADD